MSFQKSGISVSAVVAAPNEQANGQVRQHESSQGTPGAQWKNAFRGVVGAVGRALELSGSAPQVDLSTKKLEMVEASLWAVSPERAWYMKRRKKVLAFAVLGVAFLLLAGFIGQPPRSAGETWWAAIVLGFALFIIGYSTFPFCAARLAFSERRRKSAAHLAEKALRDLGKNSPIPPNKLLVYNRRQLDAYQSDSRRQQRNAFRHAQFANLTGLLVLVAGISVSLRQAPGSDQYIVAGLAGLGTLLSGFLGATFLLSARRANEQLNLFYQEPHMMGRVMMAEWLAESLCSKEESEEGKAIIAQLLTWQLPEIQPDKEDQSS